MMFLDALHRTADHVSTTKAALTGGAGSVVSIAAATVDPGTVTPWLQVATLTVGLLTGVGSGGLVLLKYWDRYTGRKKDR